MTETTLSLIVAGIAIVAVLLMIKRGTKPKYLLRMARKMAEEQAMKCKTALDELNMAIFLAENTVTEYQSMEYATGTDESIIRALKIESITDVISTSKKLVATKANGQSVAELNAKHLSENQCRTIQTELAGLEREAWRMGYKIRKMDRSIRYIAGIDNSVIRNQLDGM